MSEMTPRFQVLPLGQIKPRGWILEQMNRDLEGGFARYLDQLTEHASNDLFRNRIQGGEDEIEWWDSETRGNWLWGLTMMAYLADHPESKATVDQLVEALLNTQDEDGYIGIYTPEARYQHPVGENGELWGQSRALLTLLAYYELTGDSRYLRAVERAAQLTMQQYGPDRPYFNREGLANQIAYITGLTHGLNFVDVSEWLYRITGNTAYRDFGVWLYRDFCSIPGRFANDDFKLAHLLIPPMPLTGHAAHTGEHLRVLIWAYLMTGDPQLGTAVENVFKKLNTYIVPSGALIGDESVHGHAHPDVGYEYCTITELLWSLLSAEQKLGKGSYGDWAENLAFNAAQGARFADGTGVCYLSLENRFEAVISRLDPYQLNRFRGGRFKYSPTHEDIAVCCNPNAVRLMPHYVSMMWAELTEPLGLAALVYGPATLTTTIRDVQVTIDEITDYPFSDSITFKINPASPVEFSLLLRKPAWSTETRVAAEGADVQEQDDFYVIRKQWRSGEEVTLTFTPQIEAVVNVNGEYTIRRGVLQYVMNIPHEETSIKDYPVEGFHDYDLRPRDLDQAYHVPIFDAGQPGFGLTFRPREEGNTVRPWDNPPVELTSASTSLVPIGATVLRRSTFPMRRPKPSTQP